MAVYKVVGRFRFRGHEPGSVFEANLAPDETLRALRRRNIVCLDPRPVQIDPAKVRRPKG